MKITKSYVRKYHPEIVKQIRDEAKAQLVKEGKISSQIQRRISARAGIKGRK